MQNAICSQPALSKNGAVEDSEDHSVFIWHLHCLIFL